MDGGWEDVANPCYNPDNIKCEPIDYSDLEGLVKTEPGLEPEDIEVDVETIDEVQNLEETQDQLAGLHSPAELYPTIRIKDIMTATFNLQCQPCIQPSTSLTSLCFCALCLKWFPNQRLCRTHLRGLAHSVKAFSCDKCEYKSRWRAGLIRHKAYVHNENPKFACQQCNFTTMEQLYFQLHWNEHHNSSTSTDTNIPHRRSREGSFHRLQNKTCGPSGSIGNEGTESLSSSKDIHNKILKHSQSVRSTAYSNRIIRSMLRPARTRNGTIIYSNVNAVNKLEVFRCEQCPYQTLFKRYITRHVQRHHQDKIFCCSNCEFTSNTLIALQNHEQKFHFIAHFTDIKCDKCDFVTGSKGAMQRHLKVHQLQKSFQCETCDYSTNYAYHLIRHQNKHLKEQSEVDERISKPSPEELDDIRRKTKSAMQRTRDNKYKYSCLACTYVTDQLTCIKSHVMGRHLKLRPYKCKICGYSAVFSAHVKNHLMIHDRKK